MHRLSLLLLFLTGCAGSGAGSEPPRSLADVNRLLANREVQVERTDGTVTSAYGVTVAPDSTRLAARSGPPVLPTEHIKRITYERDRISPGGGAVGGATAAIAFVGLAMISEGTFSPLEFALGGALVAGGAVIGLLVGMLEEAGEQERVAYEGPVGRYER